MFHVSCFRMVGQDKKQLPQCLRKLHNLNLFVLTVVAVLTVVPAVNVLPVLTVIPAVNVLPAVNFVVVVTFCFCQACLRRMDD